jgi:hypothetical protein
MFLRPMLRFGKYLTPDFPNTYPNKAIHHFMTYGRIRDVFIRESTPHPVITKPRKPRTKKTISESAVRARVPAKPKKPKVTLHSDPTIVTDHGKIVQLLAKGKSWRFVTVSIILTITREIANYFPDHNTDSIRKRHTLCRRVIMETFSPEEVVTLIIG